MKKHLLLISILTIVCSSFALFQVDTKGFYTFTEPEPGAGDLSRRTGKLETYLYGRWKVSHFTSLYLAHRFDGTFRYTAMPEITIPIDNFLAMGLMYQRKHEFHLGITNDLYANSEELYLNYYPSDSTATQKMLSSANVNWYLNGKVTSLHIDATYFRLNYDIRYDDGMAKAIDDDMWSDLMLLFTMHDVHLGFGSLLKNDFNSYDGFDYGDHHVELEGNHTIKVKRKKIYLFWHLSEHMRISEAMYLNDDPVGLATVIHLRPVIKLKSRLYLKGTMKFDLSKYMRKQWYECGFRKGWRKGSSIDMTYWNVLGSIFPRQGTSFKTTLFIKKIGLSPTVDLFWRQNSDNNNYRHYKTNFTVETIFRVLKQGEITTGYSYSAYKDLAPFTNRGSIYLGIRKW